MPICIIHNKRGVASVLVIIYLPILALIMALVIDVGMMIITRNNIQAAADFGALAGAQNLDLGKLQDGKIILNAWDAKKDVHTWVEENLARNIPELLEKQDVRIHVKIYNASQEVPMVDSVNGRMLIDPTVCVVVTLPYRFYFIQNIVGQQNITIHADASVVTKRD